MFKVTKEFKFEAGHTLDEHEGKCKNLHGHNYKVFITLSGMVLNDMEMITDFYNLNQIAKPLFEEFDHAFMYNKAAKDPFEHEIAAVIKKYNRKIKELLFRSTAENMAMYFYNRIQSILNIENVKVDKVVVYETDTSFAEYLGE